MNKTYTYELKPHQLNLINKLNLLNPKTLYYLTIQQHKHQRNFTLNEIKKHTRAGIRNEVKQHFGYEYREGIENDVVSYVGIIETSKDFFWSQNDLQNINKDTYMGLHLHLFISSPRSYYIPSVIHSIVSSFFNQTLKAQSLKKIDYRKVEVFDDDFKHYHTKQGMLYDNSSMIFSNIKQ